MRAAANCQDTPKVKKASTNIRPAASSTSIERAGKGFPQVLVALYIAVLAGALTAALLVLFKARKLNQPLQFGPFLASAGLITLFYGKDILDACISIW